MKLNFEFFFFDAKVFRGISIYLWNFMIISHNSINFDFTKDFSELFIFFEQTNLITAETCSNCKRWNSVNPKL